MKAPSAARRAPTVVAAACVLLASAGPAVAATVDPVYSLTRLSCTGDDVSGTVTASADGSTRLRVALVARFGRGPFQGTGLYVDLTPVPTQAPYAFRFNVAALPPGATQYKVEASTDGRTKKTKKLFDDACAPGAVVPEVPIAVLLPLSLAGTAALVLRRRARGAPAPA